MISKVSFPENARIEAEVKIGKEGMASAFYSRARYHYERRLVSLASVKNKSKKTKLLRSSISVVEAPDIHLHKDTWHNMIIEKIDRHIEIDMDGLLQFSYTSHVPVIGSHIGILAKDADFQLRNCTVSHGSQHLTVGCLAIPDAFLVHQEFDRALAEYRRIANAFPGRHEGREAIFRAGITLLEKAKKTHAKGDFDAAYSEFEAAKDTRGAS